MPIDHYLTRFALGLTLTGALAACDGAPTEVDGPPRLAHASIPEGFDFATTRGVDLVVERDDLAAVEVRGPRGGLLYRGPAVPRLTLNLPTADGTLVITATDRAGTVSEHALEIADGVARL